MRRGRNLCRCQGFAAGCGQLPVRLGEGAARRFFCAFGPGNELGHDISFEWTPDRAGTATFRLGGVSRSLDTLLTVTPDPSCQAYDPATGCNDDDPVLGGQIGSIINLAVESGTRYYITAALKRDLVPSKAVAVAALSIEVR